MLVFADGSQVGTLGGGCVEAEVKQRALGILADRSSAATILSFCLDDDYGWDDGLICGGRMTIAIDPIRPSESPQYHAELAARVESGRGCTEAIIVASPNPQALGTRLLFDRAGGFVASRGKGEVTDQLCANVPNLDSRPSPSLVAGVAYLPVLSRITLLIVGGGHVGQAVGRLAAEADFDIEVLDDRDSYIGSDRFPTAKRRHMGDIGEQLAKLGPTLTSEHYALIVTRGHRHDEEALYHLATTKAGYVGMIGSKRKIRLIYEDLIARGIASETLERVHAPLGLDIGSQTVPEIAISILAELIACRNIGSSTPLPRIRVKVAGMRTEVVS
jgi:xanthine dehydrogenase accessory factor